MGSSSPDAKISAENIGIIPRVIKRLFEEIRDREASDNTSSYKVYVQFLEIYGEDMRDLLDTTRTSKVSIRESPEGEVFVSGAREELVSSYEQMLQALDEGSSHRVTASTKMNQSSSRSHGKLFFTITTICVRLNVNGFVFSFSNLHCVHGADDPRWSRPDPEPRRHC